MGLGSMGDSQGLGFRLRFRLRVGQGDRVCEGSRAGFVAKIIMIQTALRKTTISIYLYDYGNDNDDNDDDGDDDHDDDDDDDDDDGDTGE